MKKLYIFVILVALFSGCSSSPAVTSYKLYPQIKEPHYAHICKGVSLKVGKVFTAHTLQLEEMKYATQHYKELTYTESQWANKPAIEISRALLRSIRGAKIFDSVSGYRSRARADLLLETNIYSFMQYYNEDLSKSYVDVSFSLSLVDVKNAKAIKSTVISTRVKSETPDAEGGVVALHHALEDILDKTNVWLSESCQ